MTCATDIVAAVVAAGLFGARTMHSMCTSLTATGVVLQADVSGYADRKTHCFVNDTRFSSTFGVRNEDIRAWYMERATVGDT